MLFNSDVFIFLFLPLTLAGFFLFGRLRWLRVSLAWLVGASLFFYAWWNPVYLGLILGSMAFNFWLGSLLTRARDGVRQRKLILALGVAANLGLLGYFKYADFLMNSVNATLGMAWPLPGVVLPLAISFFTFQQITYLVDAYRGETQEYSLLRYGLFVTFFPQLIAGPIVHHKEMIPQFEDQARFKWRAEHFSVGLTVFTIGLFKKVIFADTLARYATPMFEAAGRGVEITFFEAWLGVLAYTLQLYFDFSGYSDMAIGIARMFGIDLPLNFFSPYKAGSIVEFWRRWHMTLSRFLRDYVYIALGGNRKGKARRHLNLFVTMLLGGLWHGAGWTFVAWGALHGLYLIINHGWRALKQHLQLQPPGMVRALGAHALTFVAVVVGWVFFRADSFQTAQHILMSMLGVNSLSLPTSMQAFPLMPDWLGVRYEGFFPNQVFSGRLLVGVPLVAILLAVVWLAPNTYQIMNRFQTPLGVYQFGAGNPWRWLQWQPNVRWALLMAVLTAWLLLNTNKVTEFLYFQF